MTFVSASSSGGPPLTKSTSAYVAVTTTPPSSRHVVPGSEWNMQSSNGRSLNEEFFGTRGAFQDGYEDTGRYSGGKSTLSEQFPHRSRRRTSLAVTWNAVEQDTPAHGQPADPSTSPRAAISLHLTISEVGLPPRSRRSQLLRLRHGLSTSVALDDPELPKSGDRRRKADNSRLGRTNPIGELSHVGGFLVTWRLLAPESHHPVQSFGPMSVPPAISLIVEPLAPTTNTRSPEPSETT